MKGFSLRAVVSLFATAVLVPTLGSAQFELGTMVPDAYNCLLFPEDDTSLAPPVREVVIERRVRPGDTVSAGDVLLRFNPGSLPAQIDRAAVELAHTRRKQDRGAALGQMQTEAERDEAETATAIANAALLELELEIEKYTLRAPHDGVVIDVPISVGEAVGDGLAVRLVVLDKLRAELDMPTGYFGRFSTGGTLVIANESGQAREGTVIFVEPLIDPASRTFRVHILLDNSDRSWIAGERCSALGL